MQDIGGLRHLHHEGGLARCEVIDRADARENAIGDSDSCRLRWNPAADLGQQLDQADLTQVAAFAAGIRSGEHHQIDACP